MKCSSTANSFQVFTGIWAERWNFHTWIQQGKTRWVDFALYFPYFSCEEMMCGLCFLNQVMYYFKLIKTLESWKMQSKCRCLLTIWIALLCLEKREGKKIPWFNFQFNSAQWTTTWLCYEKICMQTMKLPVAYKGTEWVKKPPAATTQRAWRRSSSSLALSGVSKFDPLAFLTGANSSSRNTYVKGNASSKSHRSHMCFLCSTHTYA